MTGHDCQEEDFVAVGLNGRRLIGFVVQETDMPLNPNNPIYYAARNIRQIQPIVDCSCGDTTFIIDSV